MTLICERKLGVPASAWRGHADWVRHATAPEGVVWQGRRLEGPVLLLACHMRRGRRTADVADAVVERTVREPVKGAALLFVSAPVDDLRRRALGRLSGRDRLVVAGAEEIGAVLDARPEVRLAMPSVLGVRDLDLPDLGPHGLDVAAARAVARVFVPTRAYARAADVLARHGFCVLTGAPEMGKTAIARMLALARLAEGWDAYEVLRPDDLLRAFDPARPQVFVADDAFGSTEYRADAAERWARDLPVVLRRLGEAGRHWLIWTSRPAPLRAGLARVHRERGLERFPAPGEVQVDAGRLDEIEKALILLRHALAAELPARQRAAVRAAGGRAVAHAHFTPERIRRLIASIDAAAVLPLDVDALLARPTEAMAASFAALEPEHRALLTAMLDQPPGPAEERALVATMRRIHPGAHRLAPAALLDRLADHFLRPVRGRWDWVHPSWRDLVVEHLARDDDARRRFLATCSVHGFALALSTGGGATGERVLPLLRDDADWDALGDRLGPLLREASEDEAAQVRAALDAAYAVHARFARAGAELRALAERAKALRPPRPQLGWFAYGPAEDDLDEPGDEWRGPLLPPLDPEAVDVERLLADLG